MRGFKLIFILLMLCVPIANAQDFLEITVRDFDGLEKAINLANQQSPNTTTYLYLDGQINAQASQSPTLPHIKGTIHMSGGVISGAEGGANLFVIDSTGKLHVKNTRFKDFTVVGFGPNMFHNLGELHLEGVLFTSITSASLCTRFVCHYAGVPTIHNSHGGKLTLIDVRFENSGADSRRYPAPPEVANGILGNFGTAKIIRTQVFLNNNQWEPPIWNSGAIQLENSSFMVRNSSQEPVLDLVEMNTGGKIEVVNSIFEGFTGNWCEQVSSLGHNSHDSPDCTWTSPGDDIGKSSKLAYQPKSGSFNLTPEPESPAIDSGDPNYCFDIGRGVFDGNGDGLAVCDRGAWEFRQVSLADGGANGVFFDPNQDGHYVYILDNDYTTLVVWNTFDVNGNQAWILALGQLVDGRSITAKAYINENGTLTNNGPRNVDRDRYWGTIRLQLDSCERGSFSFDSDLPEFTDGEFEIERLAYATQIGCGD